MGGRSKGPKIPQPIEAPEIQPIVDLIDYITGHETIEVQDGTGKKKRIIRALPKELIQDVVPEPKEDEANQLEPAKLLEKMGRLPEIVTNSKERKIFLKELEALQIPQGDQYDNIILGRRLLGELADNIQTLMKIDPQGAMEAFGGHLKAYERIQERVLEKNFDMEEARQEAILAKSGLSNSTTAADLRATRYRQNIEQRQQLKDRMLLMADELRSQELARQLQVSQEAGNLTKLGISERQQEIEAQLAKNQQDIQARQQEIAADEASQRLDLEQSAQVLHADQLNQNAAGLDQQLNFAAQQSNQQALLQQNQERLQRRGQDMSREVNLRGLIYGRSPLMESLQEFDTVNAAHLNRNAAQNNARFSQSALEQQRHANARPSGFSNLLRGAATIGGMALGNAIAPGFGGVMMGGTAGNFAGELFQ